MILRRSGNEFRALNKMAVPTLREPIPRKSVAFILLIVLSVFVIPVFAACFSESSTLGQYRRGRTLHLSVVSMERTPELRYSTCDVLAGSNPPACDPEGIERRWSISPSAPGMELVLVRAKVENHTAVSAFINVGRDSAELRDFANASFRPLPVNDIAWRDFRGESEALVRTNLGECFDGSRALIDLGSSVRWQNESGESQQLVAFADPQVAVGTEGSAQIAPGESMSHTFEAAGTFPYVCGSPSGKEWPAELRVAAPGSSTKYIDRTTRFLNGSFELPQGHGVNGFMVFEAPVDSQFRDIRWKAGDSILFEL